ncbi:hypothetical protein NTGM5_260009 [Candidatus Nitrotoga sp. M5]|nr:hypothetical protein NTGM5_260009 [Candidatus Nitrotoga sp. M5]
MKVGTLQLFNPSLQPGQFSDVLARLMPHDLTIVKTPLQKPAPAD